MLKGHILKSELCVAVKKEGYIYIYSVGEPGDWQLLKENKIHGEGVGESTSIGSFDLRNNFLI